MNDIQNLGKIPIKNRFQYKRSLKCLMDARDNSDINETQKTQSEHCNIVREIELSMNLQDKIANYKSEDWRFMIDNDYNFWIMTKEYVERNFVTNKGE